MVRWEYGHGRNCMGPPSSPEEDEENSKHAPEVPTSGPPLPLRGFFPRSPPARRDLLLVLVAHGLGHLGGVVADERFADEGAYIGDSFVEVAPEGSKLTLWVDQAAQVHVRLYGQVSGSRYPQSDRRR